MDYKSFQPGGQNQNQISTPVVSPKNFTPKFIGVVVGLLVLGGIAYGGIWYWQKQIDQEVVPTFTPRADETADWKTYTNTEYGFEFKYPNDSALVQDLKNNRVQILSSYSEGTGEGFVGFSVSFNRNTNNKNLETACFFKEAQVDPLVKNLRYDTFLNFPSIYLEDTAYSQTQEYCLNNNGNTFNVSWDKDFSVNIQILSTFKFTNNVVLSSPISGTGTLMGHVTIGPNCPVEQAGNPCTPAPQAYTSRQVMIYKADGTTLVTAKNFDTQGNYNIALMAGIYVVKSKTGIGSAVQVIGTVTIKNGQTTTLNFSIDTGIR